ncbi:hypothetical protein SCP_0109240 [Sparassis crispa]|uniref:Chromo domain-containing protein n=1 Tax=Sparassis crispa TaxID=139825 RepID=A0A401G7A2_9APHY|nr:hypothetical protein SCP_0109240 [Sparassis crispa]GBE78042.1 hypothetical protein SCP_0109240 [Sparassis crispa]
MAHDVIIESRTHQTFQANKLRQEEPEFTTGSKVYLSMQNLALPKGRARKLMPKFIGPYEITDVHVATSNYTLELLQELKDRRILPIFHVSLLRRHESNDDVLFLHREAKSYYDFGDDVETEWLVDEIVGHRWDGNKIEFHVRWTLGDHTWEPYAHCKELAALDKYFTLITANLRKSRAVKMLQKRLGTHISPNPNKESVRPREKAGTAPIQMSSQHQIVTSSESKHVEDRLS